MTVIKVCGITNVEDACIAAEAGADLLGLIFYDKSPRHVALETAASISGALQEAYGDRAPRLVGVFVDAPADRVRAVLDAAGLDLAQLHGHEPPALVHALAPRAFKAIRPATYQEAQAVLETYHDSAPRSRDVPELLVDAYHPQKLGGTGHTADPGVAGWLARRVRLLLAGGLTPENARAAIEQIRPWGVDVSSGVELRPGVKDHARVRAFIQAVRAADAAFSAGSRKTVSRGPAQTEKRTR